MNKPELIKKIAERFDISSMQVEDTLDYADAEGWLRNPGEPIDPADIRKGDRVRAEYKNGDISEAVSVSDGWRGVRGDKYFLLDRPKPKPTNAERWEKLICDWMDAQDEPIAFPVLAFADHLDEAGVKAPGDDDDH